MFTVAARGRRGLTVFVPLGEVRAHESELLGALGPVFGAVRGQTVKRQGQKGNDVADSTDLVSFLYLSLYFWTSWNGACTEG